MALYEENTLMMEYYCHLHCYTDCYCCFLFCWWWWWQRRWYCRYCCWCKHTQSEDRWRINYVLDLTTTKYHCTRHQLNANSTSPKHVLNVMQRNGTLHCISPKPTHMHSRLHIHGRQAGEQDKCRQCCKRHTLTLTKHRREACSIWLWFFFRSPSHCILSVFEF